MDGRITAVPGFGSDRNQPIFTNPAPAKTWPRFPVLAVNGQALAYYKDLIETTASVSGRASNRSASNNDLFAQRTRLKLSELAFSVAAPRIWNHIAIAITGAKDSQAFKQKLKAQCSRH